MTFRKLEQAFLSHGCNPSRGDVGIMGADQYQKIMRENDGLEDKV